MRSMNGQQAPPVCGAPGSSLGFPASSPPRHLQRKPERTLRLPGHARCLPEDAGGKPRPRAARAGLQHKAPHARLFNEAPPAHTGNCLVTAIGVIVHRPGPGRAQGSSSASAEPISPRQPPAGLPFPVPAE